jgi:hypothetical protein
MQNKITADSCNAEKTYGGVPHAVFWAVALVGLGFLIGAGHDLVEVMPEADRVLPPQTTIEDWHGNVRRGG